MRAAAFQFDVTTDPAANLATVEAGLALAAETGVELVVLPELWPTSFPPSGGADEATLAASDRLVERVRELSGELSLCVAGSAYGRTDGRPTNRLRVHEGGAEVLAYDKLHLFTATAEREAFSAGAEPPRTVPTSVGRLSGVVCYDLRFPELFRVPFRAGAEILVLPAQWPAARAAHWRALVVARAVESQCFLVAANRLGSATIGRRRLRLDFAGDSLVVSPHGVVLAEGSGQEGLVTAELELDEARRYRTRVPVKKDERVDLYREWLEGDPGAE